MKATEGLVAGRQTTGCPAGSIARGGVEGDKWFRLFDKVFSERNLLAAFQQVAKNDGAPGVDHVTTSEFGGWHSTRVTISGE